MSLRIAVLDDYQRAAESMADWSTLPATCDFVAEHLTGRALIERVAGCEVIVAMRERTPFPASMFTALPSLRLLVTTGQRNASIDLAAAAAAGVVVSGTRGLQNGVVELTWGLILATTRRIAVEDRLIRAGGWQAGIGSDLHGRVLGVLGLGKLGTKVAAIAPAFGMSVIAWSPNLSAPDAAHRGARRVDKAELFATADVVTVHLVLSDRSRGTVGEAELRSMKPSAVLINTSRGPIVDANALRLALDNGWIAGAGLDTYDTEPLPPDDPLRGASAATLTPHIGYVTHDNYRLFYGDAVEDIQAWLAGAPIRVLGSADL